MTSLANRRSIAALAAAASVVLALAGARGAPADTLAPSITLGPTTILNGVATVSGTVTTPSSAGVELAVNGQPVDLTSAGAFAPESST